MLSLDDKWTTLLAAAIVTVCCGSLAMAQSYLVSDAAEAPLRGAYEVTLTAAPGMTNPFLDNDLQVTFTRADGSQATVNGFYDGSDTFKARAYLDNPGAWTWTSTSANAGLNNNAGAFTVVSNADLPGKLRKSADDPRQFVQDNGEWFLHLGDTGYRYINGAEQHWQAYIDDAADVGFTKVRTWFGTPGSGSNGDIGYMFQSGSILNLAELQTADERLIYALNNHPDVQMQLIPFGEDTAKLKAYANDDALVQAYAREVQARYGALPNVQWTLSNDRNVNGDAALKAAVNELATDWAAAEAWGTLLTNHQARHQTYAFVDAPWSDIVTFEHLDQVTGERILYYRNTRNTRNAQDPIVNDEDRYESYRSPTHDRYFFRRLMWASLLSGGAATYGGGQTWLAYSPGTNQGVQGYHDLNLSGADDFNYIHQFFNDTGLMLIGLTPDDALVGNNAKNWKAIRGSDVLIAYLANPTGTTPETDNASSTAATITIGAGLNYQDWFGFWFNPTTGDWTQLGQLDNASRIFTAPATSAPGSGGDWLLLLSEQNLVPEPASLTLLGLGALITATRRCQPDPAT